MNTDKQLRENQQKSESVAVSVYLLHKVQLRIIAYMLSVSKILTVLIHCLSTFLVGN